MPTAKGFTRVNGSGGSAYTKVDDTLKVPSGSTLEVADGATFTMKGCFAVTAGETGKFIETGTYASAAENGIALTSSNNRPVSFLFDDAGSELAAADYRAVLSRVYLSVDNSKAITLNAIRGQIKIASDKDISSASAVVSPTIGYLELAGTANRTLAGHVAAMRCAIEEGASGTTTIAASSYYSGLEVTLNSSRTYTETGAFGAIMVNTSGGSSNWSNGLYFCSGSVDTDIRLQNGETIDNATDGTVQVTSGVIKHAVDAAAYWTATQANGGGVTFASTSDGTAGFTFSQAVTLSSDLGVSGTLDVDASISGGAGNGHLIKKTNPAGETYSGTEAALTIKHYDEDNTVVHGDGENAGLAVFFKPQSDSATGGENVILTLHKYAGATGTIKHGCVVYGDMTNVYTGSGGTATTALQLENMTALTNLFGVAAAGASSPAVATADAAADVEGSIAITVGGETKYLQYWPNPAA